VMQADSPQARSAKPDAFKAVQEDMPL